MGTKGFIVMAAVVSASVGAVALIANTKQAKMKRMLKKTGKAMSNAIIMSAPMLRSMSTAGSN